MPPIFPPFPNPRPRDEFDDNQIGIIGRNYIWDITLTYDAPNNPFFIGVWATGFYPENMTIPDDDNDSSIPFIGGAAFVSTYGFYKIHRDNKIVYFLNTIPEQLFFTNDELQAFNDRFDDINERNEEKIKAKIKLLSDNGFLPDFFPKADNDAVITEDYIKTTYCLSSVENNIGFRFIGCGQGERHEMDALLNKLDAIEAFQNGLLNNNLEFSVRELPNAADRNADYPMCYKCRLGWIVYCDGFNLQKEPYSVEKFLLEPIQPFSDIFESNNYKIFSVGLNAYVEGRVFETSRDAEIFYEAELEKQKWINAVDADVAIYESEANDVCVRRPELCIPDDVEKFNTKEECGAQTPTPSSSNTPTPTTSSSPTPTTSSSPTPTPTPTITTSPTPTLSPQPTSTPTYTEEPSFPP